MTYGPIDFIALEFQTKNLKGEIIPAILDLVQKRIVRVIDLVIIQKKKDGSHEAIEVNQLSPDLLAMFDPLHVEVSGMIQVEDIEGIAEKMKPGTTAAAMLFENLWAIQFKNAVLRANGQLIEQLRVPHEVVEEVLPTIEHAQMEAGH